MPTARIVTRHYEEALPVAERLQQLGYTVEIFDPGQLRLSVADLEINLELAPRNKALRLAEKRARHAEADVYVERGVFSPALAPAPMPVDRVPQPEAQQPPASPPIAPPIETREEPEAEPERIGEVVENTLVELGSAVSSAREGIAESVELARKRAHDVAGRIHDKIETRRAQQQAAREERQRRHQEELEQQQEREREAARQAAEIAARRTAEEEERRLRAEQLAWQRMQEEEARVVREEQQRRAAAEAEEQRRAIAAQRQAEEQRAAAAALAQREQEEREAPARLERQRVSVQPLAAPPAVAQPPQQHAIAEPDPVAAEVAARVHRSARPAAPTLRPAPRRRSLPSRRDRQWQRAALYASIVVLIVMLGFVMALRQVPFYIAAPVVPQSGVEEQVPFGAAIAAPAKAPQPAAKPATLPQRDASTPPAKPIAPARPAARHRKRLPADVADDTVIVHHYGPQRARANTRTSAGVRHFSDME